MKDNLKTYLAALVERGGSDLHLVANRIPRIRVDGNVLPLDEQAISAEVVDRFRAEARSFCQGVAGIRPAQEFSPQDFTFLIESLGRFRCHLYSQGGLPALVIRFVPLKIPSLKALGLPPIFGDLTKKRQGLVIVTGPPGSGKSTTLAGFIDKINDERRAHILTMEHPIEFVHPDKKGFVSQCELGVDVPDEYSRLSFIEQAGPDVVMLGDVSNRETLESALTLAESGHLVLLTMTTSSCLLALQEQVHSFPSDQQLLVRHRLSLALEGMVGQALLPRSKAAGRVLALEVLMPTTAVRGMIRDDKIRQIYSIMQTGQAKHGMQTMNQALADLSRRRLISIPSALSHSSGPDELRQMIQRTDARMRG